MSQKSSVPQAVSFVSQVLKRDTYGCLCSTTIRRERHRASRVDEGPAGGKLGEPASIREQSELSAVLWIWMRFSLRASFLNPR